MTDVDPTAPPVHRHWGRIAMLVAGAAVVALTFLVVLPKIADYRDVWDIVEQLSWEEIGLLVLVTVVNLATYAPPWQAALPGLRFRQAFVLTQASTASTYVAPGGAAVGLGISYAMLRGWRFGGQPIAIAVAVTGLWNQLSLLAFPIVALGLLSETGGSSAALRTVAVIGLVVFVSAGAAVTAALWRPELARWIGDRAAGLTSGVLRLGRRGPVTWTGESLVRFRANAIGVLTRRWHVLTIAILAGQLTVFVVLLTALRVLDVPASDVGAIEIFAAWSLVRLLGSLPITPGGLGVVEVGLTSALVGFGGRNAPVVAAVLVYRFLTVVPTLVLGLVAGATWRHHRPPQDPATP